jgi:hypothetical protein
MHEGPKLHEIILERCAGEQQSPLTIEIEKHLPSLAFEILDIMSFV